MISRYCIIVWMCAACSTLPDRSAGICGNGVLELGEDCDNSDPSCVQCRIACASATTCPAYAPGSYQCGADNFCHAPSGVFPGIDTANLPFPVVGGRLLDVDGDRIPDVVGLSETSLIVHFGDPAGKLDRADSTLIPTAQGEPVITNVVDHGVATAMVAVPTVDGIAAYTAQGKVMLPYAFKQPPPASSCAVAGGVPVGVVAFDGHRIGLVSVQSGTGAVYLEMADTMAPYCVSAPACSLVSMPPAGAPSDVLIDHLDTSAPLGPLSAVIAISAGTSTCVMRIEADATNSQFPFKLAQIASVASLPGEPVVLARLSPGSCPSLVRRSPATQTLEQFLPTTDAKGCTLAALPNPLPFAAPDMADATDYPMGRIALVPPIAGAGPDALLMSYGTQLLGRGAIYAFPGGPGRGLYRSDRFLINAASGDLDNNGTSEGVVSALGAADIDILYRLPGSPEGFVRYRIATAGVPDHIVVNDFDGNGMADIVYSERLTGGEELMVAYGTPDRPLPAMQVSTFSNVIAVLPMQLLDSVDPTGRIEDLVVLDDVDTRPLLTIMHGSPQRTLISYFDPRLTLGAPSPFLTSELDGLVVGTFDPTMPPGFLAFERPFDTTKPSKVWQVEGGGGASAVGATPLTSIPIGSQMGCSEPLCTGQLTFQTWRLGDRDVVITFDGTHLATIDPLAQTVTSAPPGVLPAGMGVHSKYVVDADGNGQLDLVVAVGVLGSPTHAGQVLICQVDGAGVVTSCEDLTTLTPELTGLNCVDIAPGVTTAAGRNDPPVQGSGADLVVICHTPSAAIVPADGTIWRVRHGADGYHATALVTNVPDVQFIRVGDMTGDAVDDILGVGIDGGVPVLHVFPQCEARDIKCQKGALP